MIYNDTETNWQKFIFHHFEDFFRSLGLYGAAGGGRADGGGSGGRAGTVQRWRRGREGACDARGRRRRGRAEAREGAGGTPE